MKMIWIDEFHIMLSTKTMDFLLNIYTLQAVSFIKAVKASSAGPPLNSMSIKVYVDWFTG